MISANVAHVGLLLFRTGETYVIDVRANITLFMLRVEYLT